jgi:competence protein ComEA
MHFLSERRSFVVLIAMAVIFSGTCFAGEMEKININTASLEQLMKLERVGPKYAQRIIEYRENVAPFNSPEEIMNVPGIGKKTWEANKDRIVV